MSDSTMTPSADGVVREWADVATRARARYVRRVLVTSVLVLVMGLGAVQFGAILLWAFRTTTWWALAPAGLHALAILLAVGLPSRAGMSLDANVQSFKRQVAERFGDRAARLRALRMALVIEGALLFALPLVRFLATGDTPRWGVTFTTAVCSLAILWPLQRITDAQRAETERLIVIPSDGRSPSVRNDSLLRQDRSARDHRPREHERVEMPRPHRLHRRIA
jgi:hypothetical protein